MQSYYNTREIDKLKLLNVWGTPTHHLAAPAYRKMDFLMKVLS